MSQPLIEVTELARHFPVRGGLFRRTLGNIRAVDAVSLAIPRGQTLGLVGESGCGKSTLGRLLLGLDRPTSGSIRFDGQELAGLSPRELLPWRRRMQMVFQDPYGSLSPRRTVAQSIREPLDTHGIGTRAEREARVLELLEVVGMRPEVRHRYPHEFSGGQRQRVGIARALALEPEFIVADEPVSALDVSVQSQVLNLITKLQRERGITLLFISHDLAVVQHVSDLVGVMYLGRMVELSPAAELFRAPAHPYTQALIDTVPRVGRTGRATVLSGEIPSARNPPSGCAFHTRCPRVMDVCRSVRPELKALSGESARSVACHLHSPAKL